MNEIEETVRLRLRAVGVTDEDAAAVFAFLSPLGSKRAPGEFHLRHSYRVGLLAADIAAHLHIDERALLLAGLLHDVGKALVPACTLAATRAWTAEDQASMEQHVTDGFRMLRDRFDFTAHVIAQHHRFQARGYPKELPAALHPFSEATLAKAELYARVLAVADVYDALHRVNSATAGAALSEEQIRERLVAAHPSEAETITGLYGARVLPWAMIVPRTGGEESK